MKISDPMLKDKVWFTIISGLISLNPNKILYGKCKYTYEDTMTSYMK